jgi:hypothetical protein
MLRLLKFLAVILVVTFVMLWLVRERFLKGFGTFFDEFAEGVIPWLLIAVICHGFLAARRRAKLAQQRDQRDGEPT